MKTPWFVGRAWPGGVLERCAPYAQAPARRRIGALPPPHAGAAVCIPAECIACARRAAFRRGRCGPRAVSGGGQRAPRADAARCLGV
ncbi:hypothetical protein AQ878_15900 [Burkholderia pseudomallei]|nr:hypothetical protein BOC43_18615 [Burkholderia pseudomallei]ARL49772.1 hypothetical protein BOC51_07065 [Burkholderia pseudomallei]ONA38272.1 hypothetical protein AQ878_15900 [Burkholderia pseudomallei]